MKILVFGAKGYLGSQFLTRFPGAVASDVDIADQKEIERVLDAEKPDAVINAAGKTGKPNVDWCETHKEETLRSNVTGPLLLLDACQKRGIYMVHLSSGCIYEGDNDGKGFTEADPPNFSGSFYSRTKGWADQILRDFPVLILRLRMPFDGSQSDRNLIMKLKRYPKVLDVQNSLTSLPDFLTAAQTLIEKKKTGTYNIVNPGSISPYRVMELYREIIDPAHSFERLTLDGLPGVVKAGRSNCILSGEKLKGEGITLPHVEEAVRSALGLIRLAR
ncbi:MAG: sugar nucleotide-binding protein [Candidatus Peregrinibacteria bacterium]|nr:sugar nucleotide-binding protein [Candidatus Peregrinibacteria bacterium]